MDTVTLLRLIHFGYRIYPLYSWSMSRMNDSGVKDYALTKHPSSVAQLAINYLQDSPSEMFFLQQEAEVEDSGFVGDTLKTQHRELARNRCFIERFFNCRIAVAEPVLHQIHTQYGHHRIWSAPPSSFG